MNIMLQPDDSFSQSANNVEELHKLSRKGIDNLHSMLAEAYFLLATIKKFNIHETSQGQEDEQQQKQQQEKKEKQEQEQKQQQGSASALHRSFSVLPNPTASAKVDNRSIDLNLELEKHFKKFTTTATKLKTMVDRINYLGQEDKLILDSDTNNSTMSSFQNNTPEYQALVNKKNSLIQIDESRTQAYRNSINETRDICFILAGTSSDA